jgi:hypothetical protein
MGLLDTIGEALDRPWSTAGVRPEQISANPWARRGMVLSALGNQIIPAWEQGHRGFYPQMAVAGAAAREREWTDAQRAYAVQQAEAAARQQAALAQIFAGGPQGQEGPQAAPQAALADPRLGPPGPTLQRASAPVSAPAPVSPQKAKAEVYRRAAYMVAASNPEAAKKYMDLADALDPREEYYAPTETAEGFMQGTKYGGDPRLLGVAGKAPDLPPDVRAVEYVTGKPIAGTGAAGFETLKDYRKSGASSTNTSISVGGEKAMVNAIGTGLGKQLDDSLSAARSAGVSVATANTLLSAIDSGKVVAGPAAKMRVFGLQLGEVLGVSGKDGKERLSNTRAAIQAMAKAELDAAQMMKGQGQITEAERDIIRRAASGDIESMTVPEIRLLALTMDKTARAKIRAHQANTKTLSGVEGAAPLLPFYQVEEPPAYEAPRQPKVWRYNPKTGKVE